MLMPSENHVFVDVSTVKIFREDAEWLGTRDAIKDDYYLQVATTKMSSSFIV